MQRAKGVNPQGTVATTTGIVRSLLKRIASSRINAEQKAFALWIKARGFLMHGSALPAPLLTAVPRKVAKKLGSVICTVDLVCQRLPNTASAHLAARNMVNAIFWKANAEWVLALIVSLPLRVRRRASVSIKQVVASQSVFWGEKAM